MQDTQLLVIDPQVDFCDPKNGKLYVNGAEHDMARLAKFVTRTTPKLTGINVTLDSHRKIDVGHPLYWKDRSGKHPNPFTVITKASIENGDWIPETTRADSYKLAVSYAAALESGGRYPLMVWPEHCLIGTPGHNVMPELMTAFHYWEETRVGSVDFVTKGTNIHTEHYSAIKAEVPDPKDVSTQLNADLINTLQNADLLIIAGEASSHCVANSIRDLVSNFADQSALGKIVLLTDAMSPVTGFEAEADQFIKDMVGRGMKTAFTTDFLL